MASKPQSLSEFVSQGQNFKYDELIGVLIACSKYSACNVASSPWKDLPQVYNDAELIRSTFFEQFNFTHENSYILIDPVQAQIDHTFGKIQQRTKKMNWKVAVFYYFLGYMET